MILVGVGGAVNPLGALALGSTLPAGSMPLPFRPTAVGDEDARRTMVMASGTPGSLAGRARMGPCGPFSVQRFRPGVIRDGARQPNSTVVPTLD